MSEVFVSTNPNNIPYDLAKYVSARCGNYNEEVHHILLNVANFYRYFDIFDPIVVDSYTDLNEHDNHTLIISTADDYNAMYQAKEILPDDYEVYRGISREPFTLSFSYSPDLTVDSVFINNGLLNIKFIKRTPSGKHITHYIDRKNN